MYNQDRSELLDRREMLKIKIKSLMAESKMIRHQEWIEKEANRHQRQHGTNKEPSTWLLNELREHRVGTVRVASRLTHLAYGFIRGKTLEQMESKSPKLSDQEKKQVKDMIRKYGPPAHLRQGYVEPDCLK